MFFDDEEHYSHKENYTDEDVVRKRTRLFRKCMPEKWWPEKNKNGVKIAVENLPRAYHCYKGKCLISPVSKREEFCDKDHAHEREIISCANDPVARPLALCARALRFAVRHEKNAGMDPVASK